MNEIRNVADKAQIKKKGDQVRRLDERQVADIKALLSTIEGRRFVWRVLSHCKVFESIWRPSAEIHHLSGKQDVGHFLMAEVMKADEIAFLTMMKESKEYEDV